MVEKGVSRRAMLKMSGLLAADALLTACMPATGSRDVLSQPGVGQGPTGTSVPTVPTVTATTGQPLVNKTAAATGSPTLAGGGQPRMSGAEVPTEETVLATLRPGHPRLLVLAEDMARIEELIATDATARGYRDALVRSGQKILAEPPVERVLIGPRLLDMSRRALERVYTLALLYRLDGNRQWAERATREMLAAAAFSDWNPAHFLDVAEMTHALAIGYDWLYGTLSEADRATIAVAIVEKGLRPAEREYQRPTFWVNATHNWNNVCNGGIATGALAVAEEAPDLARRLLVRAITGLPRALASYAPDGAWAEGPGYWGYATKYTVLAFGVLRSALGTDFGLSELPGLAEAGLFRLQGVGPTKLFFNFADASERSGGEPALFWLARRYDNPTLAWGAREAAGGQGSARDLLWYDPRGDRGDLARVGLDSRYTATHLAFFRSSWHDPNALYVGFKGGDNGANHAHLDLGTFVLDALGQRWALDLGPDDYNLPAYFGKERWNYYRLRTEGHNTLTLDGRNQEPKAVAPLVAFRSSPDAAFAIADLSAAYAPSGATALRRGIALLPGRERVLVQDEIAAGRPVEVVWALHTKAEAAVDGDGARLTQGGATLHARILAPEGARFAVEEVNIPAPQRPAPGVRKLVVRLPDTVASARIAVLLAPGAGPADLPNVVPLDQWETVGPGASGDPHEG